MINGSGKWKTDVGGRRKRVVEIRSGSEVEVRSDLAAVYKLHKNLRMLGNGSSL
jgi:hypothetical protein